MPGCDIPCTAASSCFSQERRCCWARGGGWRCHRCSSCCSPSVQRSRSARLSQACPVMPITRRGCAIVWCPGFGEAYSFDNGTSQNGCGRMPQPKTYTGRCHCGSVRFECTADLAVVTACNCSICTKKGLHFTFAAPMSFQLRAGEDNVKEYWFKKHCSRH